MNFIIFKKESNFTKMFLYNLFKNFQSFITFSFCAQTNVRVSAEVSANASTRKLIFNADKLKLQQWAPIFQALSLDTSLKEICIRSFNRTRSELISRDSFASVLEEKHVPPIHTLYLMRLVSKMVARHINNNSNLQFVTLKGLILNDAFLKPIMHSVVKAEKLTSLNVSNSPIKDSGVFIICNALHEVTPLEKLDMSCCGLTVQGAKYIVQMLKAQEFSRGTTAWQNSLRYCANMAKKNCGLKKILLNGNREFEDKGSRLIIEYLKDDHFIRVIGLRDCGWTSDTLIRTCKLHNLNKTIFVDLGIDLDQIPIRELPRGETYDEKLRSLYIPPKDSTGKGAIEVEKINNEKEEIIQWMKSYPTPQFNEVFVSPEESENLKSDELEKIEDTQEEEEEALQEIIEETSVYEEESIDLEEKTITIEIKKKDMKEKTSKLNEIEINEEPKFITKLEINIKKPTKSEILDIKKDKKPAVSEPAIRTQKLNVPTQQRRKNVPRRALKRDKAPIMTKQTKSLGDIKSSPIRQQILADLLIGDRVTPKRKSSKIIKKRT